MGTSCQSLSQLSRNYINYKNLDLKLPLNSHIKKDRTYLLCSQGLAPAGSSRRRWLIHRTSVLWSYHRHRCRWDNTVSSDYSRYRFHLHGLWGWTWHWYRHAAQSLQEEWQCKGTNRNMPSQCKMLLMSVEFKVPSYNSYMLGATRLFDDSHLDLLPRDTENQLTPTCDRYVCSVPCYSVHICTLIWYSKTNVLWNTLWISLVSTLFIFGEFVLNHM